ncbi:MAG: IS1182 family transposase [Parasporobacterium sp.]|nr:IS1182 family transposase [Parasporobacterium sp.]
MKYKNTNTNFSPKQAVFPVFFEDCLDLRDPVKQFDRLMEEAEIEQYVRAEMGRRPGRPGYNPVNMLKTILFGYMDEGSVSLRKLEDNCRVNLRYQYLMDGEKPSYRSFGYFIEDLKEDIEDLFYGITKEITAAEGVDLKHLYIDGTKLEANANKYTFVWKKSTEKSRYKLYGQITALLETMNEDLRYEGLKLESKSEYIPEELEEMLRAYLNHYGLKESEFPHGKGRHKTEQQRKAEQLRKYIGKLEEYGEKLRICGEDRNSYSKTDPGATFMHMKKDYMHNDQILPGYNIQIGVADEYVVVADIYRYRSDQDCFRPLMEKFWEQYGRYPRYPVADAGYGSYNNYLYCEEKGMEKVMKFTMYEKTVKDRKYRENPFRAENFGRDEDGNPICPNGKRFLFSHRKAVPGNRYGRQMEIYTCEDCSGCPYAERCKKTDRNRSINLNEELSSIHKEVLENLESIHGAYLRMNRSIQAEGAFGVIKQDRKYRRISRKGHENVRLEIFLVLLGYNLYKYCRKQTKLRDAA